MPRALDPESALTDVAWLRELARQLVRDQHRADDLAQDTWVAALRNGLGGIVNVRAWLATTLRNSARLISRRERREQARQATAAKPDMVDTPDTLVARLQEQRSVLAAVEQLAEPTRSAIMLRYLEGLPPRQIAARLGIPVATVQTRLKRGLERLRRALDERHGCNHGWVAVLAPFARRRSATSWFFGSCLLMHTHLKTTLVAALVLGAVGFFAWSRPLELPTAAQAAGELPPSALTAGAPAAASPARIVRGRAIRLDAAPLVHVTVGRRGGKERVATGVDGSFALPSDATGGEFEVVDPAWTTLFYGDASHGEAAERIIVAARRCPLNGRVVDENNRPIAGAAARIWLPPSLRARLPLVLDYSSPRSWLTTTDTDGRFALAECAQLTDVDVSLTRDGYRPERHALADGMTDIVVVLRRPSGGVDSVIGCVMSPHGTMVAGAHVAAGHACTITDQRGEFALSREQIGNATELIAVAAGMLPARAAVPAATDYLTLQLMGEARVARPKHGRRFRDTRRARQEARPVPDRGHEHVFK